MKLQNLALFENFSKMKEEYVRITDEATESDAHMMSPEEEVGDSWEKGEARNIPTVEIIELSPSQEEQKTNSPRRGQTR